MYVFVKVCYILRFYILKKIELVICNVVQLSIT